MKASPNNSTSPAEKSKKLGISAVRRATELKIGILQLYTYLGLNLRPIFSNSIFRGPARSVLVAGSTLKPQEFSLGQDIQRCWNIRAQKRSAGDISIKK